MCINGSSNGVVVDYVFFYIGNVVIGLKGFLVLYQWIINLVWVRWNWCLVDEKRVLRFVNNSQCSNDSFYDVYFGVVGFGILVVLLKIDNFLVLFKMVG